MWKQELKAMLPFLGHRNWILVVDKAFPWQSAQGVICIDTGEELTKVLNHTLDEVTASVHLKPVCYFDTELEHLSDDLLPGVDKVRKELFEMAGPERYSILHEEVFSKLDEASKLFKVVVLKTECLIPYSSVFIELDTAYWSPTKENILRSSMRE